MTRRDTAGVRARRRSWTSNATVALESGEEALGVLANVRRLKARESNRRLGVAQRLFASARMKKRLGIVAIVADNYRRAFIDVENSIGANFKIFARQLETISEDADGAEIIEQIDRVEARRSVNVIRKLKKMLIMQANWQLFVLRTFKTSSIYSTASACRFSSKLLI